MNYLFKVPEKSFLPSLYIDGNKICNLHSVNVDADSHELVIRLRICSDDVFESDYHGSRETFTGLELIRKVKETEEGLIYGY